MCIANQKWRWNNIKHHERRATGSFKYWGGTKGLNGECGTVLQAIEVADEDEAYVCWKAKFLSSDWMHFKVRHRPVQIRFTLESIYSEKAKVANAFVVGKYVDLRESADTATHSSF